MPLVYSSEALQARPRFYYPYNDVTIVVEDETNEQFYTYLFRRLFGDRLNIRRVLGVGGKLAVIGRFELKSSNNAFNDEFYLIDGDYDELLEKAIPRHSRLYRLEWYDIEATIVDPVAIHEICLEEDPSHSLKHYQNLLDFQSWIYENIDYISLLITYDCAMQFFNVGLRKATREIHRYFDRQSMGFVHHRVEELRTLIEDNLQDVSRKEFNERRESFEAKIGYAIEARLRWVSGKHILLPLVGTMIRKETGGGGLRMNSLAFRLAKYCSLQKLEDFKNAVVAINACAGP